MLITSNLRVKMAESGYTIKDVHNKTKLSRTTISNLYNDYSDGIKFDTLAKLCELFNCTPNDLILITDINVKEINYNKINTVFGLNNDKSFNENDKMIFYNADILLTLNNQDFELTVPFILKTYIDEQDLNIGELYIDGEDNTFISKNLNLTGSNKVVVNNYIEQEVLDTFASSNKFKNEVDVIQYIEYTYK
ncbi:MULTISPECIES: helix-turn-helix domain-containing protein [Mammaliicoccus]|uniref:helix-turn-helix domain-containing protein n=1 Tax=Mammaliicoccus TaxID=2803850 RepID=UPI00194FC95C|nr:MULTISPECIES: helix-turn-helix transcriptional regulator [Mammaliicoccus]